MATSDTGFPADPMHQFEILRYVDLGPLSFTNSSLWMVIAVGGVALLCAAFVNPRALVPGRMQSVIESLYLFIRDMLRDACGKEGLAFFPFVFTLFLFILACNLLGLIPGSFTVTSHIIVTFALAATVWCGVIAIGFWKNGPAFLGLFAPSGVPIWLLPLLVVIELISFLARPVTLSVRLFANMMAGHTVLKIFAGLTLMLGFAGGWATVAVMVAFTGLEVLVALLQAYVFTLLTCIYLNDALHMHH